MVRGGAYIVGRNRGHVFRFSRNQSDGHSCGSGLESKELLRVIGDQLARPASLCWNQPADSAVFKCLDELAGSQWASCVRAPPEGRNVAFRVSRLQALIGT
jgi:hypothetical protein